ncbi:MAG: MBL fold metallo-hydrolase [Gammaproteobacteria bacterium]|nr:MBL fold metallo-hydrolase [Gammaproteobacteria bacterium]
MIGLGHRAAGFLVCVFAAICIDAQPVEPHCGEEGVWIQMLGSGGAELDDRRSAASYLIWLDARAVLLVDPGPGSSLRFDEAGAEFADLDAIVFTNLLAERTADFPGFVAGSFNAERVRPLTVLGPDGDEAYPSTREFVERLIGPGGAYAHLAGYLSFRSPGGYKINTRNVPAMGQRRWAGFGTKNLSLSAVPVHHGDVPSLAWRAEVAGYSLVFTGNFNNRNDIVADFARDADALVIHLAIPEFARGAVRERFVRPSQIGRIASRANVGSVYLGHRTTRTLGRESASRDALTEHYTGPLVFADELECWGL